ncbi:MAG: aldo/keto reductase [Fimbriimonadaceae bacterium]|nr:aldo/keto reductase [Fimbriimonadaceae bacterium]
MQYRRLGRAGIRVSVIGLGTWLTRGDQDAVNARVDAALEAGINFFDTADADGRGLAETQLGAALARHPDRDLVVATQVWAPTGPGPNQRGLSRKHLRQACEASLRRLGVEAIDLYQCQRYDPETTLDETITALHDLVTAGKIHYWGVSGWSPSEVENALRLGDQAGRQLPVAAQVRANLLDRGAYDGLQPAARRHGLALLAYSPLAQGVLSGKYRHGALPSESRLVDERTGRNLRERYGPLLDSPAVVLAENIASSRGLTTAQVARAWVLAQETVAAAICGASTAEQLRENAAAAELVLSQHELDELSVV